MQHCVKCNVDIAGNKSCCPLCQGKLLGEGNENDEVFPKHHKKKNTMNFFIKLVTLICVVGIIACIVINISVSPNILWSGFTTAGIFCGWCIFMIGILKKHNIFKNISCHMLNSCVMVLIWDYFTGKHGWSVDYVFPCICSVAVITVFIYGIINRRPANEYLIYLLLDGMFSLIPLVFLINGMVKIVLPSAICIGIGSIAIAGVLIFKGAYILAELNRRMHL